MATTLGGEEEEEEAGADAAAVWELAYGGDVAQLQARLARDPPLVARLDDDGRQPLHWAASGGQVEAVRLLLARGALPCADESGWTPLHSAASRGDVAILDLLLDAGADVAAPTESGQVGERE